MHGEFVWVDLSTMDVGGARGFYRDVLGWSFDESADGYAFGAAGGERVAGVFEMPEFFQKINMPSFWMSYIAVDDIDAAVRTAAEMGGKIELETESPIGRIALIRDPAGAGFTCCEAGSAAARAASTAIGRWAWNELYVSDLGRVRGFYEAVFGWKIGSDQDGSGQHRIHGAAGNVVGGIQVALNSIKGDKEFWAVFFGVDSVPEALERVKAAGGVLVSDHASARGRHWLVKDQQGAAFFLEEAQGGRAPSAAVPPAVPPAAPAWRKWRSVVGVLLIWVAVLMDLGWVWGLLFLLWVLPDLKSGQTHFLEPVSRRDNPWIYWGIVLTWLILSGFLLLGGAWSGE